MGEVVARLGIDARHVVFGHTHRSGPLPDDDASEWRLAGGAQLTNTGCWVYESMYLDRRLGQPVLARAAPSSSRAAASRASCGCSRASTPARSGRRQLPAPA